MAILYLKNEKMAVELMDDTIFTYDLNEFNEIKKETQGKLIEISSDIYLQIEDFFNIDLLDYGITSI